MTRSCARSFKESISNANVSAGEAETTAESLIAILRERKQAFRYRRPLIVSLISSSDLERFLLNGMVGRHDLPTETIRQRRLMARREAEYVLAMLRDQPIGVQIGVVREPVPGTSFQIFRQADRSVLAISPFRLGEQPNIRLGVALITSAAGGDGAARGHRPPSSGPMRSRARRPQSTCRRRSRNTAYPDPRLPG